MPQLLEIGSSEDTRRSIKLFADEEFFHLYLTLKFPSTAVAVAPGEILSLIDGGGVMLPDDERSTVTEFLENLAKNPQELASYPLAKGRAPVAGLDAPVEWKIDMSERTVDENAQVDHYEVTRFVNVDEGDVIFTLGEPGPGTEGVDLRGNPIPAASGRAVPMEAGENTKYADAHTCVAKSQGAIRIQEDTVSVGPGYEVQGDVDFEVGNIDYNGSVHIVGTLLDGFTVKCSRDLFIGGNIEAAKVETGGNLLVGGGISGRGKAIITAEKNLKAKYINGATANVKGDVRVHTEIVNSTIEAGGRVIVERGGIIGGTVTGYREVRSLLLGSQMGVKTRILAGVGSKTKGRLTQIDVELATVNRGIEKVGEALAPFQVSSGTLAQLPLAKLEVIRKLTLQLGQMKLRRESLLQEKKDLSQGSTKRERKAQPTIRVKKAVFHNVELQIGPSYSMRIQKEMDGPVRFRVNNKTSSIQTF